MFLQIVNLILEKSLPGRIMNFYTSIAIKLIGSKSVKHNILHLIISHDFFSHSKEVYHNCLHSVLPLLALETLIKLNNYFLNVKKSMLLEVVCVS